jgi:hypothetical protein
MRVVEECFGAVFFNLACALLGCVQPIQIEISDGLDVAGGSDCRVQFEGFSRCVDRVLVFLIFEFEGGKTDVRRNVIGVRRDSFFKGLMGLVHFLFG